MDSPDPADPEEAVLAPLRRHLESCSACQAEQVHLGSFLEMGREVRREMPSQAEREQLDARRESYRAGFQAAVRQHYSGAQPASAGERPDLVERVQSVLETVARRLFSFPTMQLPRLAPLTASDAHARPETVPAPFLQVEDETGLLLAELLLEETGARLFLSSQDPSLQSAAVRITLAVESGQTATQAMTLEGGAAVWSLPPRLLLEGACTIQVTLEPHP